MKRLLLLLIVGAAFSITAFAQETKKDPAEWEKYVKEQLKLSPDQTIKYDALVKEYKDKINAVMNDGNLSDDIRKERKMALKKEKETKLFEFLTPEQQTIYKELMEKKKKEMEPKPGS